MNTKTYILASVALVTGMVAALPAFAQSAVVKTQTVTEVEPTVDGGTIYEKKTVVAPVATDGKRPVIFYYYDAKAGEIVAASDMSKEIFQIWDKDRNGYVSPQEFYENAMIIYEPTETSTTVFSDVNGRLKVTQEEYTLRLQRIPAYGEINKDNKAGISAYEFLGTGFQEADDNDDNQISYGEFTEAFYGQPRMASEQERYNN